MTTPPDSVLLDVRGLRTTFPVGGRDVPAVDEVSFVVHRGETLGLVGESGCGKSVTALSVIQLVTPPGRIAGGQVFFEGQDLLTLDDPAMCRVRGRRIGFIFQEPMVALDPVHTIGAQIEETLRVHGLTRGAALRRRTLELLDAVRMPDPARRHREYPHQLSGGLRQRAMIALAIATEPSLVIADEPTTALDVTVQAEILDLLCEMRATLNLSILLITHDIGVIARMAHRVSVMYSGHIIEEGPVKAVLRQPAHPYTQALLASIPGARPGPGLQAIAGSVPPLDQRPTGCRFGPRCPSRFQPCGAMPDVRLAGQAHFVRCYLHETRP
jgi:oligopeptide/dipeptide ABC transporter ATP-binding protein